ncbi:MAG: allophanate hydrolase [Steroidobacteraceae bacterium]|jgi:allophanate hydrolase
MPSSDSLLISDLLHAYRAHRLTPTQMTESVLERADRAAQRNIWITRFSRKRLLDHARSLEQRSIEELPLYGIPFVIKDNIDLAGVPTTAGCVQYSYVPAQSSPVVQRLLDAGAIPLGKANLDQFATGLVGTRSPYGACRNSFNTDYISGGSSSGSAVAVATGLASFALGTDTAGSGRVPAAFNNIMGLKPSLGRISTRGVVPACRSLDCVSIFALTSEDAAQVLSVVEGFDADDPYSRRVGDAAVNDRRFGIPRREQLQFFGDREYARLFDQATARIESLGGAVVEIDFAPFLDAARLLYEGPWLAERYAGLEDFIEQHASAMHSVTRQVIEAGKSPSAVDAFKAQYKLMSLKRASERVWDNVDVLMTPTAGTIYEIARVNADPIRLNTNLGYYTNFMNLLDLAGVAIPAGFRKDGLPFGVTIIGRAGTDHGLLALAGKLHRAFGDRLGALDLPMPSPAESGSATPKGFTSIAVCGAHMNGLPLNQQLRDRGGYLLRSTRTAAQYRFYLLPGGPPQRPGLVRVRSGGASIDIEVWALRSADLASFVEGISAPLGVGKIELQDGEQVLGFLCEAYATGGATDITDLGGWRAYLEQFQSIA